MRIREGLAVLLEEYGEARAKSVLNADHRLWKLCKGLRNSLEALPAVAAYDSLRVRWSLGQGAWARVPWVAFLDARVTRTTTAGVYPIYLFREDSSGLYLALSQGVTQVRQGFGSKLAREELHRRAEVLRNHCGELRDAGFSLDERLDLRTSDKTGVDYAAATAAHKLYEDGKLPGEARLIEDLTAILGAYRRCAEAKRYEFGG